MPGTALDQRFVDILDRLDEVRLAEKEIDRVRFLDPHRDELHDDEDSSLWEGMWLVSTGEKERLLQFPRSPLAFLILHEL